ncbi:hypothetical protein PoB_003170700 [Plakobranchus ocellatus]|uniref:Uncharacterized protein n=1 Tax=Plakobranchus ocellatus TaxID=259542 RepID=A0AAV4AE76_9GAST|nr:hypothetical protein PoB_003170700 [Plakobranchus ocellatus]
MVVMNTTDYVSACTWQLNDTNYYWKQESDLLMTLSNRNLEMGKLTQVSWSPSQTEHYRHQRTTNHSVLQTDLCSKPTVTFNYLRRSLCHSNRTKCSIPYSLAFHRIRICSTEEALTPRHAQLSTHLQARGFPRKQRMPPSIKQSKHQDPQPFKDAPKKANKQNPISSHI